jgi:predicted transcriptional regulator
MDSSRISLDIYQLSIDLERRRRLKREGNRVKLSQKYIADRLGVTTSTIQRLEAEGYQNMKVGDFVKLLAILEENNIDTKP